MTTTKANQDTLDEFNADKDFAEASKTPGSN